MCGKATGEKFQFRFLPNGIVETLTYRSFVGHPTTRLHGPRGSRAKEQVILNSSKISTRTMNFHRSQVSWMGKTKNGRETSSLSKDDTLYSDTA